MDILGEFAAQLSVLKHSQFCGYLGSRKLNYQTQIFRKTPNFTRFPRWSAERPDQSTQTATESFPCSLLPHMELSSRIDRPSKKAENAPCVFMQAPIT